MMEADRRVLRVNTRKALIGLCILTLGTLVLSLILIPITVVAILGIIAGYLFPLTVGSKILAGYKTIQGKIVKRTIKNMMGGNRVPGSSL
jgi:hypothetical protein